MSETRSKRLGAVVLLTVLFSLQQQQRNSWSTGEVQGLGGNQPALNAELTSNRCIGAAVLLPGLHRGLVDRLLTKSSDFAVEQPWFV